jgi:hypothetical protein
MTTDLRHGLADIVRAADRVALLRETDLGSVVDSGDVDLIVAADAIHSLLRTVDTVATTRQLHYRLRRSSPHKIGVTLYSADMAHSACIDLWVELWQIFGGRSYLRYEDVEEMLMHGADGIPRLCAELETAVYIQHLAVKGRDPSDPANASRLEGLRERCADDPQLSDALDGIISTGTVDASSVRTAEDRLRDRVGPGVERRGPVTRARRLPMRLRRRRLARRSRDVVALIGVDGSGKTSLAETAASSLGADTLLTKTAYRRSWLFRGIYKANRLTVGRPYEPIDDLLAPLTCAVAAHRLPKLVAPGTVLDRYLGDLLVVHRKSDKPRFSLLTPLLRRIDRPCTIVHIRASWSTISTRKNEVSERGHEWYDRAMREFYLGQPVFDYVAFRNDGDLVPAAEALARFLSSERPAASS